MSKFWEKIRPLKKHIITLSILAAVLVLLLLLKQNRYISEYIFARGISRYYITGVGSVTSLLPFSLYEILIVGAIVYLIYFIVKTVKLLKKRNFVFALKKLLSVTAAVLIVVIIYTITASFSYNRDNINLNLNQEKPQDQYVYDTALYYLEDYNNIAQNFERDTDGNIIPPYDFNTLCQKIREEYAKLDSGYFGYVPMAKPMFFSEIMSYMGFSGVFMSITAEPNVNVHIPAKELPLVTAHEMAHSAGVMRENHANLVAYYVLLNSDDEYLRYSAYDATFWQIQSAVYYTCGEQEYDDIKQLSAKITAEKANSAEYWAKYSSFLNNITEFINDLYLKSSGVSEGTDSYSNPPEIIDTGETDGNDRIIYDINYSDVQLMYFTIYGQNI